MALVLLVLAGLVIIGAVVAGRWLDGQEWRASLVAYRLGLPRELAADDVAAWLGHVVSGTQAPRLGWSAPPPVALEVTAREAGIRHVLLVPRRMEGAVLAGLRAALPSVRFEQADDYWARRPRLQVAAEGRLTNLNRPLAHERAEHASSALLASLSPLGRGEAVVIQWLFVGAIRTTPATGRSTTTELVATLLGDHGTTKDAEAVQAARRKQTEPMLTACVRLGVTAETRTRASSVFGWVWGCLRGLNAPGVQVVRRRLPERIVAERMARLAVPVTAWPLILNTRELTGLLGLPLGATPLPGMPKGGARQLPPSPSMASSGSVVAMSTYPGMTERRLALTVKDRLRHTWIVGPTGVGKSTLLGGQIIQDVEAGRGVVVIDPKGGDLIRDVLDRIPARRAQDVVVIDPSATDRPVGINVLDMARGEHAEEVAVDHLVHLMGSLWHGSWGPSNERRTQKCAHDADAHARGGWDEVHAGGAAGAAA